MALSKTAGGNSLAGGWGGTEKEEISGICIKSLQIAKELREEAAV